MNRSSFLQSLAACAAFPLTGLANTSVLDADLAAPGDRFKISLNAYSFNAPLTAGKTTLEEVISFSAEAGFDAADLTGYYFPGYPQPPTDEYVYRLKNKAHRLGLAISGTGIRNDFSLTDKAARAKELSLVKQWIEVAARLGAPVIRIFTGKSMPDNVSRETVTEWMVSNISECVEYGKAYGVIVAVQNHNDFIKTSAQIIDILHKINSEWFGLVLDTGSFVTREPYAEIAAAAPYAVNWQIKEKLTYNGRTEDMDLTKLFRIVRSSPYRGYLPIETLSAGDPFTIVPPFLKKVREALNDVMNG